MPQADGEFFGQHINMLSTFRLELRSQHVNILSTFRREVVNMQHQHLGRLESIFVVSLSSRLAARHERWHAARRRARADTLRARCER